MKARDAGRCERCDGRLTATHMLLATYPLDPRGSWWPSRGGLSEDIVVACSVCGDLPPGSVRCAARRCRFVAAGRGGHPAPGPIGEL